MKQKSIKFNAAMNMLRVATGMLFPLVTFPYTSRVLGPDGIGKVNFAGSFVSYFVLLASIGIPLYGVREVAKVRDDREALGTLVQELLVLHIATSAIAILAYLGCVAWNPTVHAESLLFLIVGASIPLSMLTMDWLYQGMEEYVYITVRSLAFSTLSVAALFLFVHHEGDYRVNAIIGLFASLGSSVLNFWNARKLVFSPRSRPLDLWRHVKPLLMVYALNFIVSIYVNLDTVMLGFLSTARSVGFYSSAMKLVKMLLALVSSFGAVLLPRLAWYLANDKRDEFDQMLRKSLGFMLLLCLPVTSAIMIMSREILLVFAGQAYLPAADCILVTAPVILFIALTGIFGIQILYPLGREKDVVFSVGFGAVVSFGLNLILIPRWAHMGAAWATFWAEVAVLVVQLVLVRRRYRILWPWSNIAKYVAATVALCAFLFAVRHLVPENRLWLRIALDVPVGAGLYFGVLLALRENLSSEVLGRFRTLLPFH